MNKDSKLIFEAYISKKLAVSDFEKNLNINFGKIPVGLQKFYRTFAKYLPDEIPGAESLNDIVRSLQNYREDSETKQLAPIPAGKQETAILDDLVAFGILTKKGEAAPETEEPKEVETLDSDEDTGESDIDVAKELGYNPGEIQ